MIHAPTTRLRPALARARLRLAIGAAIALAAPGIACQPASAPQAQESPSRVAVRHSPRDGSPFIGRADATDTLLFFTDYQCPVCPRAAREMDRLVEELGGWLKVEVRHNPLPMHPAAFDTAVASRAAQWQGKFWEYNDLLLATSARDRDSLIGLAVRAGCDKDTFVRDLDREDLRDTVLADIEMAAKADIGATPGFVINGHSEIGWASYSMIRNTVQRYRKGAGSTPSSGPAGTGS